MTEKKGADEWKKSSGPFSKKLGMIFEKDAELFLKDIRGPDSFLLFSVEDLGWE